MRLWWNGIHNGLKTHRRQRHTGSNPVSRTKQIKHKENIMTSKVTVEACCDDNEEVKVLIKTPDADTEQRTLQDGETADFYVYDDREIVVREIVK